MEESQLRAKIAELVREYYERFQHPKLHAPFTPGETPINYAGRWFGAEEMVALVDSSLDFRLTADRYAREMERELAKRVGVKYALLVNSGSSANLIAFRALTSPLVGERRIRPGDEVITVAAGFPTTVAPIIQYGAVPVFLDVIVDDGTYNIDVTRLEEALSSRTRAIMIAHTLGNPFNLKAVTEFCTKHDLWLVEDNCDALGSLYDGKLTGTFGHVATSSFYPAHHITTGEGGAVYMSKGKIKRAAESFRDWGRDCWCEAGKDNTCGTRFSWKLGQLPEGYDHKYTYSHFGYNLKLTDMQAAIGCVQLTKLEEFASARRKNWTFLRETLKDLEDVFVLPNSTPHSDPSWFGFILTIRQESGLDRTEITRFLEARKIQTRVLFAGNLIRHPLFDEYREDHKKYRTIGDLENSDRILNNTFWVGVFPGLDDARMSYMAESIRAAVIETRRNKCSAAA